MSPRQKLLRCSRRAVRSQRGQDDRAGAVQPFPAQEEIGRDSTGDCQVQPGFSDWTKRPGRALGAGTAVAREIPADAVIESPGVATQDERAKTGKRGRTRQIRSEESARVPDFHSSWIRYFHTAPFEACREGATWRSRPFSGSTSGSALRSQLSMIDGLAATSHE